MVSIDQSGLVTGHSEARANEGSFRTAVECARTTLSFVRSHGTRPEGDEPRANTRTQQAWQWTRRETGGMMQRGTIENDALSEGM
jgi:hypothetical protein